MHTYCQPAKWHPQWLPANAGQVILDPLLREDARRSFTEVDGDPFLSLVNLKRYRCEAQREAVRATLSVPEAATVVVNLPTGSGKSLCAQLPGLLKTMTPGLAVIVVPTVSLALDQERSLRPLLGHESAYVGGEDPGSREQNESIRRRILTGEQRIVFTSPEAALGSLHGALCSAAIAGMLRVIAIDEAHMVEQWG
ncbi:MAG: DEAD/DEAH box helicase [Gemmatimonadetes bacterium]|nr:DEAD/DEAH box helicase [Gemmatimonadota bacterium]